MFRQLLKTFNRGGRPASETGDTARQPQTPAPDTMFPFGGDLEDFTVLRHHAVHALCGVLMDRHTDCRSPHPFCGPGHWNNGDVPTRLIAQAVPQTSAQGQDLIGIYLCPADGPVDSSGQQQDVVEFVTRLTYTRSTPDRKLVIFPPKDGVYPVQYGPIVNPVEGDYSTGQIDQSRQIPFRSDPEPSHCRWQYWDSHLTKGDWLIPTFHCLQVFGEWWVVDVDRTRNIAQQVAALDFADNPDHKHGDGAGKESKDRDR